MFHQTWIYVILVTLPFGAFHYTVYTVHLHIFQFQFKVSLSFNIFQSLFLWLSRDFVPLALHLLVIFILFLFDEIFNFIHNITICLHFFSLSLSFIISTSSVNLSYVTVAVCWKHSFRFLFSSNLSLIVTPLGFPKLYISHLTVPDVSQN